MRTDLRTYLEIYHPLEGTTITGTRLLAQGFSHRACKVQGWLILKKKGPVKKKGLVKKKDSVLPGVPVPGVPWGGKKDPRAWVLIFENLDAGSYSLVVQEMHHFGTIAVTEHVVIQPTHGFGITWPSNGGTVSGANFTPYGTTSNGATYVGGGMDVNQQGFPQQGTVSGTNWQIQFTGLPQGTGAMLTVNDDKGGSGQVTGLTVQ
jgi:hypothetical protein